MIRILVDTGVRVGELVKLRQRDLVERDRNVFLRVQGKGERERLVPMAPALARRLRSSVATDCIVVVWLRTVAPTG
jgi:integrase